MMGLAKRVKARILQASTSEIYGDPEAGLVIFFSGRSKSNHPPQRINGSTQVISASELRRIRDAIGVTEVIAVFQSRGVENDKMTSMISIGNIWGVS